MTYRDVFEPDEAHHSYCRTWYLVGYGAVIFKGPTSRPALLKIAPVPVGSYTHTGNMMHLPPNELYSAFSFIGLVLCAIPFYWHFKGKRATAHLITRVFILRMTT